MATFRRFCSLLIAAGVTGCNPPLKGGLYDFHLVEVVEDTCGGLALEEGIHDDASLWWGSGRDEMIVLTVSGCWYWDYADGVVTSSARYDSETGTDCLIHTDVLSEGTLESNTAFSFTQTYDLDAEGDCSGPTTAMTTFPCRVELFWEVDRIGDTSVPWEEC